METAISGLEAEIDLFDGSDQIATQCIGLGLGAVAQQALAELGVGLAASRHRRRSSG